MQTAPDCVFCKIVAGVIPATVLLDEADGRSVVLINVGHRNRIIRTNEKINGEMIGVKGSFIIEIRIQIPIVPELFIEVTGRHFPFPLF